MFIDFANLGGIVQRLLRTRRNQGATHDGLSEFSQYRAHDIIIGYAHADGFTFRVHQAPRHHRGCLEQERVGSRRQRFHQAIIRVGHLGIGADFGKVAANQREVMLAVGTSDALDAFHRGLVTDVATERIA